MIKTKENTIYARVKNMLTTKFSMNTKRQSRRNLITYVQDRPGHDRRYAIDFCKLSEKHKRIPEEHMESGIKKTFIGIKITMNE